MTAGDGVRGLGGIRENILVKADVTGRVWMNLQHSGLITTDGLDRLQTSERGQGRVAVDGEETSLYLAVAIQGHKTRGR
jgi:hypothetical protein